MAEPTYVTQLSETILSAAGESSTLAPSATRWILQAVENGAQKLATPKGQKAFYDLLRRISRRPAKTYLEGKSEVAAEDLSAMSAELAGISDDTLGMESFLCFAAP